MKCHCYEAREVGYCQEFCPKSVKMEGRSYLPLACTEPKGHEGPHIACGTDFHCMVTWPKEDK